MPINPSGRANLGRAVLQTGLDTQGLRSGLQQSQRDVQNAFQRSQRSVDQQLQRLQTTLGTFGRQATMRVTAPLVALGAAAGAAFNDVDRAMSQIARATGATGRELDRLGDDFRAVFREVPQGADQVAIAIGEINTRLGLTGDLLQDTARDMLDFARIAGEDVGTTVREVSTLMNALEIDASRVPEVLDKLAFAAQESGVGVNELARNIIDAGPAFVELGFDLDRAIGLFAEFERAGVRPQEILGSLNIALTNLAREGFTDSRAAFDELLGRIRDAPSLLEGVTIAADAFGSRAGARLAEDIRAGRFEVDEWVTALEGAEGTLSRTAEESLTLGEQLAITRNRLIEIGDAFVRAAGVGDSLSDALNTLNGFLDRVRERIEQMDERTAQWIVRLGIAAAAIGPFSLALSGLIGVVRNLTVVFRGLMTAMSFLLPGGAVVRVIALLVGAAGLTWAFGRTAEAAEDFTGAITDAGMALTEVEDQDGLLQTLDDIATHLDGEAKRAWQGFSEVLKDTVDDFDDVRIAAGQAGEAVAVVTRLTEVQQRMTQVQRQLEDHMRGMPQALEHPWAEVTPEQERGIREGTERMMAPLREEMHSLREEAQALEVQLMRLAEPRPAPSPRPTPDPRPAPGADPDRPGVPTGRDVDPLIDEARRIQAHADFLTQLRDSDRMDAQEYEQWIEAHLRRLAGLYEDAGTQEQRSAVMTAEARLARQLERLASETTEVVEETASAAEARAEAWARSRAIIANEELRIRQAIRDTAGAQEAIDAELERLADEEAGRQQRRAEAWAESRAIIANEELRIRQAIRDTAGAQEAIDAELERLAQADEERQQRRREAWAQSRAIIANEELQIRQAIRETAGAQEAIDAELERLAQEAEERAERSRQAAVARDNERIQREWQMFRDISDASAGLAFLEEEKRRQQELSEEAQEALTQATEDYLRLTGQAPSALQAQIASLEALAKKYPEIADELEQLIEKLREFKEETGEAGGDFNQLLSEISRAANAVGQAIGGVAADFASLVSDVASGIARIASGDVIGGVVQAATGFITGMIEQFQAGINAAQELREEIEQIGSSLRLIDLSAFAVTRREAVPFWGMFGLTREVVDQELADVAMTFANAIERGFIGGMRRGAQVAAEGGTFDEIKAELERGLFEATTEALFNAIIEQKILEGALGPLLTEMGRRFAEGDIAGARAVAEQIRAMLPGLAEDIARVMEGWGDFAPPSRDATSPRAEPLPREGLTLGTRAGTVLAAPAWEARMGQHIDRFGGHVGRLVDEGIRVVLEREQDGRSQAWEFRAAGAGL